MNFAMGQILNLELPSDVYEAVKKAAEQSGQTPAAWIAAELPRLLAEQDIPKKSVAPLYKFHEHAVDTGITNLAEQHDHYLYGKIKQDEQDA